MSIYDYDLWVKIIKKKFLANCLPLILPEHSAWKWDLSKLIVGPCCTFWQSKVPKDICPQNVNLICNFCHAGKCASLSNNLHLFTFLQVFASAAKRYQESLSSQMKFRLKCWVRYIYTLSRIGHFLQLLYLHQNIGAFENCSESDHHKTLADCHLRKVRKGRTANKSLSPCSDC